MSSDEERELRRLVNGAYARKLEASSAELLMVLSTGAAIVLVALMPESLHELRRALVWCAGTALVGAALISAYRWALVQPALNAAQAKLNAHVEDHPVS